ncbi:hypothetical protein LTR56_013972 [Elasticomyces elasticus]|nr:hypothetical protein LTR56_013972 [Elasticomyces elasticus]KAK3656718.1 hypothetical protein LTR22_009697 [Elasticomyces elasticus]KAK4921590.1 hypothetical protein LTR49_011060 [Elasticomyces elasticus]KAK5760278.1 hypothetical protein LTS12_009662 [Elasticomyces elasticus]
MDDPDVVEAMLDFCYHSTVSSTVDKENETYTADIRLRIYCIASKIQNSSSHRQHRNVRHGWALGHGRPQVVLNISRLAENDDFFALLLEMPTLNRSLLVGNANAVKGLPGRDYEAERQASYLNPRPTVNGLVWF